MCSMLHFKCGAIRIQGHTKNGYGRTTCKYEEKVNPDLYCIAFEKNNFALFKMKLSSEERVVKKNETEPAYKEDCLCAGDWGLEPLEWVGICAEVRGADRGDAGLVCLPHTKNIV